MYNIGWKFDGVDFVEEGVDGDTLDSHVEDMQRQGYVLTGVDFVDGSYS